MTRPGVGSRSRYLGVLVVVDITRQPVAARARGA
jgi:hypothetical protein